MCGISIQYPKFRLHIWRLGSYSACLRRETILSVTLTFFRLDRVSWVSHIGTREAMSSKAYGLV
jgi:hypothetical protein